MRKIISVIITSNNMLEKINLDKTKWSTIQKELNNYSWIMTNLDNQNDEFVSRFSKFYKLNLGIKNAIHKEGFFNLLKLSILSKNDNLPYILKKLAIITNRNEISFSSKIAATVNPQLPVVDKCILGHLKINRPSYGNLDYRIQKSLEMYDQIVGAYQKFLESNEGEKVIAIFDKEIHLPDIQLTRVKKLDFILWQTRN